MIERENGERNSWIRNVQAYADEENVTSRAVSLIAEFIKSKGHRHGRVGLELDYLPRGLESLFRDALPDTQLVDISAALARLRIVKSREEQDLLRLGVTWQRSGHKRSSMRLAKGSASLRLPPKLFSP